MCCCEEMGYQAMRLTRRRSCTLASAFLETLMPRIPLVRGCSRFLAAFVVAGPRSRTICPSMTCLMVPSPRSIVFRLSGRDPDESPREIMRLAYLGIHGLDGQCSPVAGHRLQRREADARVPHEQLSGLTRRQ